MRRRRRGKPRPKRCQPTRRRCCPGGAPGLPASAPPPGWPMPKPKPNSALSSIHRLYSDALCNESLRKKQAGTHPLWEVVQCVGTSWRGSPAKIELTAHGLLLMLSCEPRESLHIHLCKIFLLQYLAAGVPAMLFAPHGLNMSSLYVAGAPGM